MWLCDSFKNHLSQRLVPSDDPGVRRSVLSLLFIHGWPNLQQYRGSGERLAGEMSSSARFWAMSLSRLFVVLVASCRDSMTGVGSMEGVFHVRASNSGILSMLRLIFMHG